MEREVPPARAASLRQLRKTTPQLPPLLEGALAAHAHRRHLCSTARSSRRSAQYTAFAQSAQLADATFLRSSGEQAFARCAATSPLPLRHAERPAAGNRLHPPDGLQTSQQDRARRTNHAHRVAITCQYDAATPLKSGELVRDASLWRSGRPVRPHARRPLPPLVYLFR